MHLALLATSRNYAMVWDEGHTVRRERTLADWFSRVAAGGGHFRGTFAIFDAGLVAALTLYAIHSL